MVHLELRGNGFFKFHDLKQLVSLLYEVSYFLFICDTCSS